MKASLLTKNSPDLEGREAHMVRGKCTVETGLQGREEPGGGEECQLGTLKKGVARPRAFQVTQAAMGG